MEFLKEAKESNTQINVQNVAIHCRIFEDNFDSGTIELAKVPKMHSHTKHLNIKYHHFHQHVQSGLLSAHAVKKETQIADIFTKPLNEVTFPTHQEKINGW